MMGDGNCFLRSGNFVHVGDERTSPTSSARAFKCARFMIGFGCTFDLEIAFLSRFYEMRSGCEKNLGRGRIVLK